MADVGATGAGRLVDVATLTGGVVTALGSVYAGLMSNDDELAGAVLDAGGRSGELVWRLPLHERRRVDLNRTGRRRRKASRRRLTGRPPWANDAGLYWVIM